MTKKAKYKLVALLLCFVIAVCGVTAAVSVSVIKYLYPVSYYDLVKEYSREYDISEELLLAVIKTESSFDPEAVSAAGALGLTQITPDTFNWLQTKTGESLDSEALKEPEVSIKYGAFFLHLLLDEFGNTETAVAAYHAGRGRVNGWLEDAEISSDGLKLDNIPVAETAHYVRKVMRAVNIYSSIYKLS